jgi:regulator of sigma E protease
MNFITAIFLLIIMIWAWGNPVLRPNSTEIGAVESTAPAYQAGLREGDTILEINGEFVTDFNGLADYIKARPEEDLVVKYRREDADILATIRTQKMEFTDTLGVAHVEGRIGISPVFDFNPTGFGEAVVGGAQGAVFVTVLTVDFLWKLITRQESIDKLGGPIMIADQAGKALKKGLPYLVNLAAFLSINLAVLNILPIPVLDGGHLVFLGVEAIRRKPIPFKKRLFWQQVGMGLLLLLMVFVTYNDIARLITGGQ